MKVQVLVDNPKSWIIPYVLDYIKGENSARAEIDLLHRASDVKQGDILFLLSCERIADADFLKLNRHNLVVHESDLPKGKGWSPLTWQILEGKNNIKVTLFEAAMDVDAGDIYYQTEIQFSGNELVDELREKQAKATFDLMDQFLDKFPDVTAVPQEGEESFYSRRVQKDSELDVNKTISEQFNNLRVADNERYPCFFYLHGQKYILKVEKEIVDEI